ncbi:MAG: acyltransferase family protein [Porticoccaceae bacterium]
MSKCSNWPARLYALDVSRGFASLAVVLWHWQHFAFVGYSPSPEFVRESQPFYSLLKICYEAGEWGVDYFFILSGFIFFWLYHSSIKIGTTSFTKFWIQRFSRLYPLHFVTLLIVALLQFLYSSHNKIFFVYPNNDTYHFLLNLTFATKWGLEKGWSFNAPVWSVSIEILLYFAFFWVAFIGLRTRACLVISTISFAVYNFLSAHPIFLGLSMYFLGGILFHFTSYVSRCREIYHHALRVGIYATAILAWGLVLVNFYVTDISLLILDFGVVGKILLAMFNYVVLPSSTVCSLALLEIDRGQFLKPFSWIGDITYSSYLWHFPFQLVFGLLASYKLMPSLFYLSPFFWVAYFVLLTAMSLMTFHYFERPAQKWLRTRL